MKSISIVCECARFSVRKHASIRSALVAVLGLFLGNASATESIQELTQQLKNGARHQAIRRLGEIGTPAAQAVLLAVALGREGRSYEEWAAHCYVKTLENRRDARRLLNAAQPEVIALGFSALRGESIDEEILSDVRRLLAWNDQQVRNSALYVTMAAPENRFPRETVEAVLECIRTATSVPFAERFTSGAGDWWSEYTEAGWLYRKTVQTLCEAKGITDGLLEELTPTEPGIVRDCVFIARGWRGDKTVRPELYRLVKEAKHPNIRGIALNAFAIVGSPEDLPLLEEIAKSDPYRIELTMYERRLVQVKREEGLTKVDPEKVYPNRIHAEELIHRIKTQASAPN